MPSLSFIPVFMTAGPPSSSSITSARPPVSHAVIIGAGPSGLCTALLLHNKRLASKITLVDRAKHHTPPTSSRQFSFLLTERSASVFRALPNNLCDNIIEDSVGSLSQAYNVIPAPGIDIKINNFPGERKPPEDWISCWISREKLLDILEDGLPEEDENRGFEFRKGANCVRVDVNDAHPKYPFTIHLASEGDHIQTLQADLLIGADGVNGTVRTEMHRHKVGGTDAFDRTQASSPATELRYKTIQIPERIYLKRDTGFLPIDNNGAVTLDPSAVYLLRWESRGRVDQRMFNMGFLPMGIKATGQRSGTIVRPESNKLWAVQSVEDGYKLFEENFPQLDVRRTIPEGNMKRFVEQRVGKFPKVTGVNRMGAGVGKGAVVLIGDAAHAFPPDLGQGVNSGLQDVWTLVEDLSKLKSEGGSLNQLAEEYAEKRGVEISALLRLMVYAAPYQYQQNMVGLLVFGINTRLRTILAKRWPGQFWPAAFAHVNQSLSYAEVEKHVEETTRKIVLLGAGAIVTMAGAAHIAVTFLHGP